MFGDASTARATPETRTLEGEIPPPPPAPLVGRRPRVVIVLNATPPADGAPALLTPLDVRILFHEFGHALHMLLSDVAYPRVAGINVASDVVEFPSKLHEALAFHPAVLPRYARHHETGERRPRPRRRRWPPSSATAPRTPRRAAPRTR